MDRKTAASKLRFMANPNDFNEETCKLLNEVADVLESKESKLTLEEIHWALCTKDPRYPMFQDIYDPWDDEEELPIPRQDCSCDSCFYGQDRLAMEILRLRGEKQ